jgi:tetratricopeptide (TPR) repeat protein
MHYARPLSDEDFEASNMSPKEQKARMTLANKLNEEGSALMQLKKHGEAAVKFNEAIEQGGNLTPFLYNRGLAYLNLNQDDKARADFLEAYRRGDEDAGKIYNNLFK